MDIICEKCGRPMKELNFYSYRDGSKMEICKKCLTMHVDNFDESTYLWIIEKLDIPYLPKEWNAIRDKAFADNPQKMNGTSVVGKYVSKMKLKQWSEYHWADTEKLQKKYSDQNDEEPTEEQLKYEALLKEQYEKGEISEAQYRTLVSTRTQKAEMGSSAPPTYFTADNIYNENNFMPEEELVDPSLELTKEDKLYLAMKWGRLYKPEEWVQLEKKYAEMHKSFDIQDSDTDSTLILICKTYLKMNQAIDCGDVDGYQKLSRVYDTMRKSSKFTAVQNKEESGEYLDSIGEFVALCEREGGFIPRFATDIPQDKVDLTLKDMNNYLRKLVVNELGFGQQIEDALKKIQLQKEMNAASDDFLGEEGEEELEDKDYVEFYELVQEQKRMDKESEAEE